MKFIHIADMHFDSPFVNLSDKEAMGDLRRLEQRKVFKKIIKYIKENDVSYFFIAGDLYEHQYVKKSTIDFINNLFKEIPQTKVFIAPGNHDPYLKNSYYNKYTWNNNVKIFCSEIERVELPDVDIYGFGFDDFYCTDSKIEDLNICNKDKINILVLHATLDGALIEEKQYNSISKKILKEKKFDYVALGHIHKLDYNNEDGQKIVYPGSTVSLGFDEMGEHGMIVGEIDKHSLNIEFIPLDEEEFIEYEIDVTEINSLEDLVEEINEMKIEDNQYVKIILKGNRNFEINVYEILKLINNQRIIKLKDFTRLGYDLGKISGENTLKGLFAKNMKKRLEAENLTHEERDILERAVEIGIEVLE